MCWTKRAVYLEKIPEKDHRQAQDEQGHRPRHVALQAGLQLDGVHILSLIHI